MLKSLVNPWKVTENFYHIKIINITVLINKITKNTEGKKAACFIAFAHINMLLVP